MKNKKVFLHIFLIILIAIPMYFMFHAWIGANAKSNPDYKYETVTATEPRVYVTNTGDCYHSASCGYLHSKTPMGKYEAQNAGYRACSACHGTSSGTIEVSYQKRVLDTSDSKAIGGGIALTIICAPFLYLMIWCGIKSYKEDAWIRKKPSKCPSEAASETNIPSEIKTTVKMARLPIGTLVEHNSFGEGIIEKYDNSIVYISFDGFEEEEKWKRFQFPKAFEDGYLVEINKNDKKQA